MDIRREIFKAFKSRGLSVRADASKAMESILRSEEDALDALYNILEAVESRIEKREVTSNVIDVQTVTDIVAELSSTDDDLYKESTELFDAYHSPKLVFDEKNKTYKVIPGSSVKCDLFGDTEDRANMYRERLSIALHRMLRNGLFTARGLSGSGPVDTTPEGGSKHEISTVASLLGSNGTSVLLGIITQPEEGGWYLEDLSGSIQLDLSEALQASPVLVTEGSIVIAEGVLGPGGHFLVKILAFPPAEKREVSLAAIGVTDVFGGGWRPQHMAQMQSLEAKSVSSTFVVLSDVHLDKPHVCDKLQEVFDGFEGSGSSIVFILIGSFITKPVVAPGGRESAISAFSALADMICKCPNLAAFAKFVLIPGPFDPVVGTAFPRRHLPKIFTKELTNRVAHISFASNPCRVRFFTQEIVIFREDLLRKMMRHLVVPLQGGDDQPEISQQIVRSIVDQAHLCSLPAHCQPVYWQLDHSMRLFPLPHLLILADHAEQYEYFYEDCAAVNPGSFASDYSFVVYRPASQEIQLSKVPS